MNGESHQRNWHGDMRLSALDRKLFRDLWHMRGQVVTVALIVASGIATYVTMRGAYESVERAQQQFDEKEAAELQRKIRKNKFDFNDFYSQIQQIKKMGNVKDLVGMIPGVGKAVKDMDIDDNAFKGIEAIIFSMTPEERSKPELINGARRQRIAKGSGQGVQEVNKLLKQFEDTRKMMRMMNDKNAMAKLMRNMPKGMMGPK